MNYRHTVSALPASLVVAALLASCSNGEASSPPRVQTSETETAAATTAAGTEGERADYQAVRFQAEDGVERLAVVRAARTPGVDVAGVVSLSTPQFPSKYYVGEPQANDVTPARLKQLDEPKLFIAGKDDVQVPGSAPLRPGIESVRFAEDARRMFDAAGEPKKLALVNSSFHSSELVTTAPNEILRKTRALIFRFLKANS